MDFDKLVHLLKYHSLKIHPLPQKYFLPENSLLWVCRTELPTSDVSFQMEGLSVTFLTVTVYLQKKKKNSPFV